MAVWGSQVRPVQDSTESGTATVAVPDSTGPGFDFVTNGVSVSNTSSIEIILLSRTPSIKID